MTKLIITMKLLILVSINLFGLIYSNNGLAADAQLDTGWRLHLTASVGSTNDLDNYAGVAETATNGFDRNFDIPETSPPPSYYVQLYFPHPEWHHLLGDNFTHDIRSTTVDLSDSIMVWEFEVDTDQSGSTVTLVITPENVPAEFGILLIDSDQEIVQNLRHDPTYSYTAESGREFQLIVGDSTAPSLAVTAPDGGELLDENEYTITWTASDGSGVESFELAYSTDNGLTYIPIATVDAAQNSYHWPVPELITYQALIRITATDKMGNVAEDVSNHIFTISAHEQSHQYDAGWNLISVPLIPDDPRTDSVIGDDVVDYYYLYKYANITGYSISDSVINGKGYWLASIDNPLELEVQGLTVTEETILPLGPGWNIIGNPLVVPVPKSLIEVKQGETRVSFDEAVSMGWISNALYTFSAGFPGYQLADTLAVWCGYWLGTFMYDVNLIISPLTVTSSEHNLTRQAADSGWTIKLEAHSDEYSDLISAFGVSQAATNGFDPVYDDPEPPMQPDGNGIRLYFPHPEWGVILGDKFNRDIQAPLTDNESRSWAFDVQRIGSVSLSWDVSAIEKSYLFTLTDLDAGISTDMSTSSEYTYTGEDEIRHFRLDVTTPSGVEDRQNSQPLGYDLAQNYPNPFNPQTEIRFQLPKAGKVSILIYNHLGQKLRTLIDSHKLSGEHLVTWNARDDAGQLVPSGIYFYKLQVGSNVLASRKMILLK